MTIEQDTAAGGLAQRQLRLNDGVIVVASISVRSFKRSHQLYGYLQFKRDKKTVTRYVGNVTAETKLEALVIGWRKLREMHLVEENGWMWV